MVNMFGYLHLPEAGALKGLLDNLLQAQSRTAAFATFARAMSDIGFQGVMYIHRDDGICQGITATTYDKAWIEHYVARNYTRTDPTRQHAMYRQQPFFWREIYPLLRKKEKSIFQEARDFSMVGGIAVPIFEGGILIGGVGLATDRAALEDSRLKVSLSMAASMFCAIDSDLYRHEKKDQNVSQTLVLLTRREIEIVRRMADGCSNTEISDKMNIAIGTVEYHARNIATKLTAPNRTAAVAKAFRMGLI